MRAPWRLPPKDFQPFTTVQNRFYAGRDSGLWAQIVCVLTRARQAASRVAGPPPGVEHGRRAQGFAHWMSEA
jgi:hypothetical protein